MKTKTLVAAFAAFLPAALVASVPADAEPARAPITLQPLVKVKTSITVAGSSAVPGEKKTFDVSLGDVTGKPLAGKTVELVLAAKAGGPSLAKPITIGSATTGANGHASITWSCADLGQGNFDLQASFAGDATDLPSKGSGNLFVAKALTKFVLSDLSWGTYKNEPGSPSGTMFITFTRTSDNKGLDKPVTMTVNGKSWPITTTGGFAAIALFPLDAKSWDVKVQFDGDDSTIANSAERHYTHP